MKRNIRYFSEFKLGSSTYLLPAPMPLIYRCEMLDSIWKEAL